MTQILNCYDVPEYWDLAFSDDTQDEADFVVAAVEKYCDFPLKSVVEPGCGGGRLLVELAGRGIQSTGWDLSEPAVKYANQRLAARDLPGQAKVADMRTGRVDAPVDAAYCYVSTFRHLLTDEDAVAHLKNIAACLRSGGLYVIGLHLLPPDADEEDSEEWTVSQDGLTVDMRLDVTSCSRIIRQETLRFEMLARDAAGTLIGKYASEYRMRLYDADSITRLLTGIPEFRLLPEVYDFWYDITDPLTLSDEMGDTVLILQKQ